MKLEESRILLTGASGGIGLALAASLAAGGARLLLAGRQADALRAIAASHPDRVSVVSADLRQRAGRESVIAAARSFGGLDCVVNAAGVSRFGLVERQDDDAVSEIIQLNVTSAMQLTGGLLPMLRESPKALVVNVGSIFGSIGYPGFAAYCASKFAMRGFSEALRRELADTRIKVLYVAPRATRTPMNADAVVEMNRRLKVAMDDPRAVAERIVDAIRREREELYIGWPEKIFVRLNGLLPRVVDQALRKQLPVVQRFARNDP
ncbi:MAG: SDR family oxidoreductase [Gammaproteobacteria bacterium]